MRTFFKFISTLSLSLLFLLASNSYAMYTHHCGGEAVDSSFMTKSDGCGMEMHSSKDYKSTGFNALPCCSDIVSQMTSGIQSFSKTNAVDLDFVPEFYPSDIPVFILPKISEKKAFELPFYDPPNRNSFRSPYPALIQVFIL